MSYDVYIDVPGCPHCTDDRCRRKAERIYTDINPTYNLTAIFHLALTGSPMPNPEISEGSVVIFKTPTDSPRGLRILSERAIEETAGCLTDALNRLHDSTWSNRFNALAPSNGWGPVDDAKTVLRKLLTYAVNAPQNEEGDARNQTPIGATWVIQ